MRNILSKKNLLIVILLVFVNLVVFAETKTLKNVSFTASNGVTYSNLTISFEYSYPYSEYFQKYDQTCNNIIASSPGYEFTFATISFYRTSTTFDKDEFLKTLPNALSGLTPKKFTISYNANGGSVSTTSKKVTYDSTFGELPTPTRTGYTFAGWFTAQDSGSEIKSDTKVAITADTTLYAQWKPAHKVELDDDFKLKFSIGLGAFESPSLVEIKSSDGLIDTSFTDADFESHKNSDNGLYEFSVSYSPVYYDKNITAAVYNAGGGELYANTTSPTALALVSVCEHSDYEPDESKKAKAYLMYCEAMKNIYYGTSDYLYKNDYSGEFDDIQDYDETSAIVRDETVLNKFYGLDVKNSSDFEMTMAIPDNTSIEFLIKAYPFGSRYYRKQSEYQVTINGEYYGKLIGVKPADLNDVYYAIRIENISVKELDKVYQFEIKRLSDTNNKKMLERYTGSFTALDFIKKYYPEYFKEIYTFSLLSKEPQ